MNSIGGVILEQIYCPPERPSAGTSPTSETGGFFQHLRDRVSHFTDVFSFGHQEITLADISSKNSELLDNMATAGP